MPIGDPHTMNPYLLYPLLAALGIAIGAVGTFMGAGGGFVLMPVLAMLYPNEPAARLASMSLAVVCLNAISGSIGYARQKRIDYHAGALLAAATVPGAVIGALITGLLSRLVFDSILGAVIIAAAAFIAISTGRLEKHEPPHNPEHGPVRHDFHKPLGVGLSFCVGFMSSLLGIGGGIVHVPVMVFFLRFPVHAAVATSHFVLAITALVGTIVHVANGEFDAGWRRTTAIGIGVVIGAQIGALLAKRSHGHLILRLLAVGLVAIGVRVIFW